MDFSHIDEETQGDWVTWGSTETGDSKSIHIHPTWPHSLWNSWNKRPEHRSWCSNKSDFLQTHQNLSRHESPSVMSQKTTKQHKAISEECYSPEELHDRPVFRTQGPGFSPPNNGETSKQGSPVLFLLFRPYN